LFNARPAAASYYPLSASFIVTVSNLNLTTAFNDSGIVFSSLNASDVISKAIAALPYPSGGTVLLRSGAYCLDSPISIERCSVTLRGEARAAIFTSTRTPSTTDTATRAL